MSNSVNFYIDPVTTITAGTSAAVAYSVIAQTGSEWGIPNNTTWNPATATYTSSTILGNWPVDNAANILFDGVTFTATNGTLNGESWGVVSLGNGERTHERMTFLNCTFSNNTGAGSGNDRGVNGVKVTTGWRSDHQDSVNDVTFAGCLFGTPNGGASAFSRMGYEQQQGSYGAALRVAFKGCTFEPVDGEIISVNAGDLMQPHRRLHLQGSDQQAVPTVLGGLESNQGQYIEVRDCDFWGWTYELFNFNGDGSTCNVLFTGCDIDNTHRYQTLYRRSPGHCLCVVAHQRSTYRRLHHQHGSELVPGLWECSTRNRHALSLLLKLHQRRHEWFDHHRLHQVRGDAYPLDCAGVLSRGVELRRQRQYPAHRGPLRLRSRIQAEHHDEPHDVGLVAFRCLGPQRPRTAARLGRRWSTATPVSSP